MTTEERTTQFICKSCEDKGRPTAKGPSSYKIDGFTACIQCVLEEARGQIEGNGRAIAAVFKVAQGDAKQRIAAIVARWEPEVAEPYSGKGSYGGKGRPKMASDRSSDLLAHARIEFAPEILAICRQDSERARTALTGPDREKLLAIIDNNIAHASNELDKARELVTVNGQINLDQSTQLRFRDRRRFWGAASQAYRIIQGLPESIGRVTQGEQGAREFARSRFEKIFGKNAALEIASLLKDAETASRLEEPEEPADESVDHQKGEQRAKEPPAEDPSGTSTADSTEHPVQTPTTRGRKKATNGRSGRAGPAARARQEASAEDRAQDEEDES